MRPLNLNDIRKYRTLSELYCRVILVVALSFSPPKYNVIFIADLGCGRDIRMLLSHSVAADRVVQTFKPQRTLTPEPPGEISLFILSSDVTCLFFLYLPGSFDAVYPVVLLPKASFASEFPGSIHPLPLPASRSPCRISYLSL